MSVSMTLEVGGKGFTLTHRPIINAVLSMLIVGLTEMKRSKILVVNK